MFTAVNIISLSGVLIDFIVCVIFAFRLFRASKKNPKNQLLRYFKYYFLTFACFLVVTPLYMGQALSDSPVVKPAFLLGFLFLFLIANIVLSSVLSAVSIEDRKQRYIKIVWAVLSAATWLYMVTFINPGMLVVNKKWEYWGFTPFSIVLVLFVIGAPILSAVGVFLYSGYKNKKERAKFFLLALGFLLVIIGGPLHQYTYFLPLYVTADVLTSVGFLSSFLALLV